MNLSISHPTGVLTGSIELPLSKSESNRILILQALSQGRISTGSLSDAHDTRILEAALSSDDLTINIEDAGTAMRFLTAYFCVTNQHKILTGSERMYKRPIGILVDALRGIGFDVRCIKEEGFPPLEIIPTDLSKLKNHVSIAGNVSSQYISALMMIAPVLEKGLDISFITPISSKPYIDLTVAVMRHAGIKSIVSDHKIEIAAQPFKDAKLQPNPDWSAAGYWFSMAALSAKTNILLHKLQIKSHQGDSQIAEWIKYFGVNIKQDSDGLLLYFDCSANSVDSILHFDFADYPDLAQTLIVLCAAKNIKATFTGLESLRIKETDRISALQDELIKFGIKLEEFANSEYRLSGHFVMSDQTIKTYNDHRMAMAFAPLCILSEITIEQSEVVKKSYPDFWSQMAQTGFQVRTV